MREKIVFWAVAGGLIAFDQISKALIKDLFPVWHNQNLFLGAVSLPSGWVTLFSLIVFGLLVLSWFRGWIKHSFSNKVFLGLIVGGGLSNLIDRVSNGYVIDYLKLGFWPSFNLADVFITLGVALLVLPVLRTGKW